MESDKIEVCIKSRNEVSEMEDKEFLTTGDVARWCKIPYITALSWVKAGKIKSRRTPGGHYRITRSDFVEFLEKYEFPIPDELRGWRKKRVLIVDDEPAIVDMVENMLQMTEGIYETATASNGFDAALAVVEFEPDLVILDINMPGLNGIQVCKRIRTNPKTTHIKILGITATEQESIERLLNAGADDCLQKPLNMMELQGRVQTLLQK